MPWIFPPSYTPPALTTPPPHPQIKRERLYAKIQDLVQTKSYQETIQLTGEVAFTQECFVEECILNILTLVTTFPKAKERMQEMKTCLESIDRSEKIVKRLIQAFQSEILNASVETEQIIANYISTIHALLFLDNSGIMLEEVAAPIRKYLRHRDDTVRTIMAGLLDEENTVLSAELSRHKVVEIVHDSNENRWDDKTWIPAPRGRTKRFKTKANGEVDILESLVNVYDSLDLFIKEFQNLMSSRLLSSKSFGIAREKKNIELLKQRFGDRILGHCEVMIADMDISHHLHDDIGSCIREELPLEVVVISNLYWPTSNNIELWRPPPMIRSAMDKYESNYKEKQTGTHLEWMHHLGSVDIEVELRDQTLELTCSPFQAALLLSLSENRPREAVGISADLCCSEELVQQGFSYWTLRGIVKQLSPTTYQLVDSIEASKQSQAYDNVEDTSLLGGPENDPMEEHLSYVMGMLQNRPSATVQTMHSMLELMMDEFDMSVEELKKWLDTLVLSGQLLNENGEYKKV